MITRKRRPSTPGQILLKHHLEPNKITVTRFAQAAKLSTKHVSQIIHGHAALSPETVSRLTPFLPGNCSRGNPVDVIGDADGERYARALEVLLDAPEVDAVLVMHAPTATADSTEAADAVIAAAKATPRTVLTAWIGGDTVGPARDRFFNAGMPS